MLVWSDDYRIGMKELDAQHLILFSIINQIDINIESGRSADLVEDVLGALAAYIEYHFRFEEQLMREHGYPDADLHAAQHAGLWEKMRKVAAAAATTDRLQEAVKIRKFAIDWLVDHILQDDLAFADFVHARELDTAEMA